MDINEIREALMDLYWNDVGCVQVDNAKQQRKKEQPERELRKSLRCMTRMEMLMKECQQCLDDENR